MNIYDQMHKNMPKEDLTNSFIAACHVGDVDALVSLLTNPEYEKHIDVHYNNDAAFQWLLYNNRIDAMKYLILEYKIDKTETINRFLSNSEKEGIINEAIKMFQITEISSSLEKDLVHNKTQDKKIKL